VTGPDADPDGSYFEIEPAPEETAPPPAPPPSPPPPPEHRTIAAGPVAAESVSYARGGRTILTDVSLRVAPGEALAVVGPSGSGKSSLLALLAGLEPPDAGRVRRAAGRTGRDGLILQGYGLVSVLTAAENVEAPLQAGVLGRITAAEIRRRAASALASVGLTPVADHVIEELSGGQQQRVAIARALVVDPPVVLADELTAELDHEWKTRVIELVLDVARRGGVVILATHDPELAGRCDHVLRLVDGRVVTGS
jgi:putative ABC transport system ATP-binding protein